MKKFTALVNIEKLGPTLQITIKSLGSVFPKLVKRVMFSNSKITWMTLEDSIKNAISLFNLEEVMTST